MWDKISRSSSLWMRPRAACWSQEECRQQQRSLNRDFHLLSEFQGHSLFSMESMKLITFYFRVNNKKAIEQKWR